MQSVGHAYAILKGRASGNRREAYNFLEGLSPAERTLRNRQGSRLRRKAKKNIKVGSPVR